MAPKINPPPLIDIAIDINPYRVKFLNPIGVSGNIKANINIIKLERIPLTPAVIINSSLYSLTYTAIKPATIFDASIPNPERFAYVDKRENKPPAILPITTEESSNLAIYIYILYLSVIMYFCNLTLIKKNCFLMTQYNNKKNKGDNYLPI